MSLAAFDPSMCPASICGRLVQRAHCQHAEALQYVLSGFGGIDPPVQHAQRHASGPLMLRRRRLCMQLLKEAHGSPDTFTPWLHEQLPLLRACLERKQLAIVAAPTMADTTAAAACLRP